MAVGIGQMELLERPPELTRAAARKLAMEAAPARAELGADRAGARADAAVADWCLLAADKLRVFMPAASSNGSPKATYRKGAKA